MAFFGKTSRIGECRCCGAALATFSIRYRPEYGDWQDRPLIEDVCDSCWDKFCQYERKVGGIYTEDSFYYWLTNSLLPNIASRISQGKPAIRCEVIKNGYQCTSFAVKEFEGHSICNRHNHTVKTLEFSIEREKYSSLRSCLSLLIKTQPEARNQLKEILEA